MSAGGKTCGRVKSSCTPASANAALTSGSPATSDARYTARGARDGPPPPIYDGELAPSVPSPPPPPPAVSSPSPPQT
eukprot:scaffold3079_cov107-Isochrysis_galbana.AAC.4